MPTKKKRTKANDLPKTKQELTPKQAKRVKGGSVHTGGVNVLLGDGSVRFADIKDGTSNTLLTAEKK